MTRLHLPDPPLTDGELLLRPWTLDDVPAVTAACRDPEIPRWTVIPFDYEEHHATEFISAQEEALADGRELALGIVDAEGRVLGSVGITNFDWPDLKGEIGYWVAREARRRQVGTRAVRLLSRWAIEELGLERLELFANPENEGSLRLAVRAGFTREGTLRQYRKRRGIREDLVMHSLLATDLAG